MPPYCVWNARALIFLLWCNTGCDHGNTFITTQQNKRNTPTDGTFHYVIQSVHIYLYWTITFPTLHSPIFLMIFLLFVLNNDLIFGRTNIHADKSYVKAAVMIMLMVWKQSACVTFTLVIMTQGKRWADLNPCWMFEWNHSLVYFKHVCLQVLYLIYIGPLCPTYKAYQYLSQEQLLLWVLEHVSVDRSVKLTQTHGSFWGACFCPPHSGW